MVDWSPPTESEKKEVLHHLLSGDLPNNLRYVVNALISEQCPVSTCPQLEPSANIRKDLIWRLLASARLSYEGSGRPFDKYVSGIEDDPNSLLEFLANSLLPIEDYNEHYVEFEKNKFPELKPVAKAANTV
jgi:hypothetical protein